MRKPKAGPKMTKIRNGSCRVKNSSGIIGAYKARNRRK